MASTDSPVKRPRAADEGSVLSGQRPRVQSAATAATASAASAGRSVAARTLESGAAVLLNTDDVELDATVSAARSNEAAYSARAAVVRVNKAAKGQNIDVQAYESDDEAEIVTETADSAAAPKDGATEGEEDDFGAYDVLSGKGASGNQRKHVAGRAAHDDDSSDEEAAAKKATDPAAAPLDDAGEEAFDSAEDESDEDDAAARRANSRRVVRVRGEQPAFPAGAAGGASSSASASSAANATAEAAVPARSVRWATRDRSDGVVRVEGGVTVEAFNLDAEREEGHFEENFNYVRHGEEGEGEDAWMRQLRTAEAVPAARGAAAPAARPPLALPGVKEAAATIARLLRPGETVTGALARLGRDSRPPSARARRMQRAQKGSAAGAEAAVSVEAAATARGAIADLTTAAEALLGAGDEGVYDRTAAEAQAVAGRLWAAGEGRAEEEARAAKEAAAHAAELRAQALADSEAILWVYRVGAAGQAQGPFSSTQMLQWAAAGYFSGSNGAVECRRAKHKGQSADLSADLDDIGHDEASAQENGAEPAWEEVGPWQDASSVNFRSFAAKE